MSTTELPVYKKKDFQTDQDVRWCPGCGDYAILSAVQSVFPELGIPKENFVVVSGIGCSSRFPYYMNTYGFHTIHGRAPAVATGIKIANPELEVWVATGDGDALSIGGNHMIHMLRRNVDIKVLLFNNRIYGLTKGQYSPDLRGRQADQVDALRVARPAVQPALAGARGRGHLRGPLGRHLPAPPEGSSEESGRPHRVRLRRDLQNCNIFNDGAWENLTAKGLRDDHTISLEHGQPLVFGKDRDKGIRLATGSSSRSSRSADGVGEEDLLVHDERNPNPAYAFLLSRMDTRPDFPTPIGVLRASRRPATRARSPSRCSEVTEKKGPGDLATLLHAGDTWEVQ